MQEVFVTDQNIDRNIILILFSYRSNFLSTLSTYHNAKVKKSVNQDHWNKNELTKLNEKCNKYLSLK